MIIAGFRERDMKVERELARFMDNHLYNDGRFSRAERTDSREAQLSGSDIILSIPSLGISNIIVDEKGMTQYMNNPLQTFSLELSFMNYDREITGWFVDDEKATQYYMLIWPKAKVQWDATYDDIIEVEYALVSKDAIRKYLETKGYTKEVLIAKAKEIRKSGQEGAIEKGQEDFWFYYTTKLVEKPINLILRKKIYQQLAIIKGKITK